MGMNYYQKTRACPTCQRYDERHIGKSSAGWTFSFRGYENIRSYKDWLKVLNEIGSKIFDEYGGIMSLENFRKMIKAKKGAVLNHSIEHPEGNWLDDEGHSFSDTEFS